MGSLRSFIETVRSFLFSILNKEFLTFLFFLAVAGIFWLLMTLNETYEKEFNITTRIVGVPNNVVLTSEEYDTIRVTLRDKGFTLLSYTYSNELKTLNVNFMSHLKSDNYGAVTSAELQRLLQSQLSASTQVAEIKDEKLEIYFNHGLKKRVPVRWQGKVTPEQMHFISHVACKPDSVDVYATEEQLDTIMAAYTEQLHYSNFRDTLCVDARLHKMTGVKFEPASVSITFFTDVLTEESIGDIPITGINMPKGKVIRTFPSKVTVKFVTGMSKYKTINPKEFTVVVDYNEIAANPSDKCNIYLKAVPADISRATLEVKQVDYLIEEE